MISDVPRPRRGFSPLPVLSALQRKLPVLAWLGLIAGSSLVIYAYARAAVIFRTQAHYHLFWLGILAFTIPACLRLLSSDAVRTERLGLLVAVGVFDFLPKFLRDPQNPLYHDELAHWRQAESIYATGTPFQPNPVVPIIQYFPGLHTVTVAFRDLTGLSTFQLASMLLPLLHVMALIGVFVLAEQLTRDARVAAIAAFLYSLNSSFMFFDSQYSYESLAVVFFIWVIALTVRMHMVDKGLSDQARWFALALMLSAACVITHHLTSYALVIVLLMIAGVTCVQAWRNRESRSTAALTSILAFLVAVMAVAWMIFVASKVIGYLEPSLRNSMRPLINLLAQEEHSRTLFANSQAPAYEQIAAYLSPVIVAFGAALGLYLVRGRQQARAVMSALVVFGLLYFPSVPLMLTTGGSEGARRTWAFTYLGVALLIAPALVWLLQQSSTWPTWRRRALPLALTALACVVLVGNVTVPTNDAYRFPGAFVYGSDTRSLTPELSQTTQWFQQQYGTGQRIIADRYSGLALSSFGMQWTMPDGTGFPTWEMFLSTKPTSRKLLQRLQSMGYRFLIIDKRMVHQLPLLGFYVTVGEPLAGKRTSPPPSGVITKYDHVPWASKVYESTNYEVFRLNYNALAGSRLTASVLTSPGQAQHLHHLPMQPQ